MRLIWSLLLVSGLALADSRIATIELNDGSVVRGQVTTLSGGSYRIESQALGRLTIRQDQVASIRYGESSPSPAAGAGSVDLADLQKQMAGNPAILSMIQQLQNDPQIQALISDPQLQKAIQSGDIGALLADPRFLKLLDNPRIKDISRQVTDPQ
jgi:hypothetical protein